MLSKTYCNFSTPLKPAAQVLESISGTSAAKKTKFQSSKFNFLKKHESPSTRMPPKYLREDDNIRTTPIFLDEDLSFYI